MNVHIDGKRCTGHGRCYVLAPSLFTDDDAGYGQVIGDGNVTAETQAEAELVVMECPEGAITLID
jgi:ferredoxin